MAQLRFGGLESQGNIVLAVSTTGSDTPSANRPARITRGDYSAYPFLTIQAAIDALPPVSRFSPAVTSTTLINVGVGSFAGFLVNDILWGNAFRINGTRQTATPTTGPATGTATGGGTRRLTDSGATWTTDDLVGRYVNITSGPGSGQILLIGANDATNIYFADPCSPLPASGSVYVIEDLATVINSASARVAAIGLVSTGIMLNRNGNVLLRDIKIVAGAVGYFGLSNQRSSLQRVVVQGPSTGIVEQDTGLFTGSQIGAIGCASLGIGLYNVINAFNSHRGWLASGCAVGIDLQVSGGAALYGVYARNCSQTGLRVLACDGGGMKFYYPLIDAAGSGMNVQTSVIGLYAAEIRNSVYGPFYLFMSKLFVEVSLIGTGNAGWGMYVNGAANHVQLTGVNPTITGTSGEVTVDGTTDVTWAALLSGGSYATDPATRAHIHMV